MPLPEKRIHTPELLEHYLNSRHFANFWAFLLRLNEASRDRKRSSVLRSALSEPVRIVLRLLDAAYTWVSEIPPVKQSQRFGNKAFRTWHARLVSSVNDLLTDAAPSDTIDELAAYLTASFGSAQRLDYGTGHEALFLAFLCALVRTGGVPEDDFTALSLCVFPEYLRVTRALQKEYMLEPAGSKGVWGLDDYSFLPFIFGSSQLLNCKRIPTNFVNDDKVIRDSRNEYLYIDAIGFIKDLKTGPFHEHSPSLFDISRVRGGWQKINQGMLKMYKAEVMEKFPVMQHFLFGSHFPFPSESPSPPQSSMLQRTPPTIAPLQKESSATTPPSANDTVKTRSPTKRRDLVQDDDDPIEVVHIIDD